jgi:hypothetical protein
MKKAGELLSQFFDRQTIAKVQRYAAFCEAWPDIASAYAIAAAGDHAKIVRFERQVLCIETDHPGWIQILQTKQRELLHEFQRRFPETLISGISFRLSLTPLAMPVPEETEEPVPEPELPEEELAGGDYEKYEKMDEELKNTFKRLKQHLRRRSGQNHGGNGGFP